MIRIILANVSLSASCYEKLARDRTSNHENHLSDISVEESRSSTFQYNIGAANVYICICIYDDPSLRTEERRTAIVYKGICLFWIVENQSDNGETHRRR